ncbi:MAG: redoxin domain-containing protein [Microscillaceae bacterium]|jgi:peroxiredoxin|nr:redoxin domain-containing protein [Microscillaceae bacterium]
MKLYYKNILWLIVLGSLTTCGSLPGTKPGNVAPDFRLKDLAQTTQSLQNYRGKVVLLHFWTDFCQSCRAEFPLLQESYQALKSPDFELLVINIGQSEKISQDFQRDFKATFPMIADKQKITQDLYEVQTFPTNYFINPEGKIIRKITGWLPKTQIEVIVNQHKKKS